MIELTALDLKLAQTVFLHLGELAAEDGMKSVEVRFTTDGGDYIIVGYGESGEPAIIGVVPLSAKRTVDGV